MHIKVLFSQSIYNALDSTVYSAFLLFLSQFKWGCGNTTASSQTFKAKILQKKLAQHVSLIQHQNPLLGVYLNEVE